MNNASMLQFKKTAETQSRFCDFIASKYKTHEFLFDIDCSEKILKKVQRMDKKNDKRDDKKNDKKNDKKHHKKHNTLQGTFLLNNMRMTLCELG
jgi:hypothetical protein